MVDTSYRFQDGDIIVVSRAWTDRFPVGTVGVVRRYESRRDFMVHFDWGSPVIFSQGHDYIELARGPW